MSGGKHASEEEFELEWDGEKIRNIAIILVILAMIGGVIFGTYKMVVKMTTPETKETSAQTEDMPNVEYPILGTIQIDKIDVKQPILDSVEDKALEKGVIKLYGDGLNQEGNFCIAGHNYERIFKRLEELEVGDEIQILEQDKPSAKYKVTQTASVEPTDLELLRKEEGKTQITLITCANYSTKRWIVKAEIEN